MRGLVLIPVTAVTVVIEASRAAGSMGEFYPAFQLFLSKSLLEVSLKLVECGFDISIARARIKKAEEL